MSTDNKAEQTAEPSARSGAPARGPVVLGFVLRTFRRVYTGARRIAAITVFSSLTRRIVTLNLAALAALVIGILYLNQWREGLIDARVQSLRIQGEIIAAAIAASATVDSDVITINPDRLLESIGGASVSTLSFFDPNLEFPINPERVAPLLGNLVTPTRTRARIYDSGGLLILDSADLYSEGELLAPPVATIQDESFFLFDWWNTLSSWAVGDRYSVYQEYGPNEGKRYPEVEVALSGAPADIVRIDNAGRLVISVAVPVQRQRATVGALLMSTQPGEIDAIVRTARWSIVRLAVVAALVTSLLSVMLAGGIAGPVRRLSAAALSAKTLVNRRAEIPDYTDRRDEIGMLSGSLREMTDALYDRIEAIERFAADVAHELKNPLTSLRSAVETLPGATRKQDRDRLIAIVQHDVRRLDRLISDISNASRLDAELARETAAPLDLDKLVQTLVAIQADTTGSDVQVVYERHGGTRPVMISGHDSRLAQVLSNLIDNAVSFSPTGGTVTVRLSEQGADAVLEVADEGPGISGDAARVFERFYTDRPATEQFGNHSGLGLSISRQIVDAHQGTIVGANRTDRSGALFSVTLPRLRA